jgi:hypothetical protein
MTGRKVRMRMGVVALVASTLAAGCALALASADPAAAATLDKLSDRTHKVNLLGRLGYHPKLVFFGGSRSMRLEPLYARERWGLRGFNAAVQGNEHEDVWALFHHMVRRAPDHEKYVVWGIQPGGFFANATFDVGLLRDRRLKRYFSSDVRAAQGDGLVHRWAKRRYVRDGAVVYDDFDRAIEAGRTLTESLDAYIRRALRTRSTADTIPEKVTRTRRYFEKTLTYMNAHGCEPLLIIMPVHPRVIRAVRDEHWDNRRASFAAYLAGLQETHRFTVLDFTFIESFGGDPGAFYDGVHMKKANLRRLLRAAVRQAPWAFGRAPAPWDEPAPEPSPTPTPTSSPSVSAS